MEEDRKRIIGLLGEMYLAIELHERGWQVFRAYIDEQIDFIIARYYCDKCKEFSKLEKRPTENKKGTLTGGTFPTNLCYKCETDSLKIKVRFLQAKASEGIKKSAAAMRYSFHAKLRSNVDPHAFYVWIAITDKDARRVPHFYIFHHTEIDKFDDLSLPSYQKTDNQKTTLQINTDGLVLNKGTRHDYSCFNDDFYNNFEKLERERWPSG